MPVQAGCGIQVISAPAAKPRWGRRTDVEWIKYSTEGHGCYANENTLDFWTRVEAFLDKHIGKKR